jgi:glycosyltransferase 2 family protein
MATRGIFSWNVIVGYGVAAILLWLFLRNAEWPALAGGLRSVAWTLLAAAVIARLCAIVVAAVRWQLLLAPVRRVPFGSALAAMLMGMTLTAVGSMQAAEVARPYLLSRRMAINFSATFATVVVEWLLDLVGVLAVFVPAIWWARHAHAGAPARDMFGLDATILLAFIGALSGLAALRLLPARLARWIDRRAETKPAAGWRARVREQVRLFVTGLQILERPNASAILALYSVGVALLVAISSWLTLIAFGLPVTLLSGFLVLGLVTVGGMIPTPGALGGFHAICQLGLVTWFQLDPARTVLPVIGLHAVLYLPGAAIGALCFLSPGRQGALRPL